MEIKTLIKETLCNPTFRIDTAYLDYLDKKGDDTNTMVEGIYFKYFEKKLEGNKSGKVQEASRNNR